MHIIGFVLGSLAVAVGVAAAAASMGFSNWSSIGLATASFVLAQFLYLAWVAAMAHLEARRRKLQRPEVDNAPVKPAHSVVQKG